MNIALFLSSDGIALAHRQTAGHWAMIGETALDVPDLSAALADLRAMAVDREGDSFKTLLVLPDDQILYTSLTAPTADPSLTAYRIEDGLEGLTPYAVTELEYDWQVLEEDRVKIAVVARETLDEARGFASQYGFTCKGFAAMPPMERFPGVPTFGLGNEAAAMGFDAEGIAFGPDIFGQPAPEPEPAPESEPEPAPVEAPRADAKADPEPTPEPGPKPEREVAAEPAPQAEPDPKPTPNNPEGPKQEASVAKAETAAPTPKSSPEGPEADAPQDAVSGDQTPALADALRMAGQASAKDEEEVAPPPPQVIEDPSVSGPIAPITTDGDPTPPEAPNAPQEVVGDAGDGDDILPPAPSPASLVARQRANLSRTKPSADAAPQAPPAPASGTLSASRGPSSTLDGTSRPIATPDGSGRPVGAPPAARGALVGQRSSRLGLAHPDGPARTEAPSPAAPSATTSSATTPSTPPPSSDTAPGSGTTPMPRLAEQLQRVRNASKSRPASASPVAQTPPRPRVEITTQSPSVATGMTAPRRPSPFDAPPEGQAGGSLKTGRLSGILGRTNAAQTKSIDDDATPAPGSSGAAAALGGLLRRRSPSAEPAPEPDAVPSVTAGDETFMSGLLVRKSVKQTGGSFKTGLVLTVILLLLLALVAIWSAMFLPNSAVARLFGGSSSVEVASGNGLTTPEVGSSAPVIGAVETSLQDEAAADGIDLAEDDPTAILETPVAVEPAVDVALPDIDADLDLPSLPAIDQGQNPSVEEAQALYAEDGIWARSPERPDLRPFDLMDRVYTASIDPEVSAFDAVALPEPGVNPGEQLRRFPPPPAFGTEYDLTASGLVAPTPNGVLTPEGAFIISGVPPRVAVQRPREVASATPAITAGDAVLSAFRPAERPGDLSETRERQILGGLTQVELGERRPAVRPASPQEAAAQASLFSGGGGGADPDAVDAAVELALQGTDLAVDRSLLPRTRPGNIEQIVASADRTPTEAPTAVAAASAVAAGPSIPSNADVSRAATERNAIRLRNVNLIGVSGSASDRRALVRLSSGRFVRVTVGDRLDGGRVAAIGETTLQYVRSGRTVTLEIPG